MIVMKYLFLIIIFYKQKTNARTRSSGVFIYFKYTSLLSSVVHFQGIFSEYIVVLCYPSFQGDCINSVHW